MKVFLATLGKYFHWHQEDALTAQDIAYAEQVSQWPLVAFLITAMCCLGSSATCHLCYVKDKNISDWVSIFDYWGIAVLFLGSCYPFISYKYACGPFIVWRYIFTSIISVLVVACMYATMTPMSSKRRAGLFSLFAASCTIPTGGLVMWHDERYSMPPNLMPFIYPIICYAIGMTIFLKRIPECWDKTGKYDLCGNSHNWWHMWVNLGILITCIDNFNLYKERLEF